MNVEAQLTPAYIFRQAKLRAAQRKKINGEMSLDEWFIYEVDGEKRYYKVARHIPYDFVGYKQVNFLGIGRPKINAAPSLKHRKKGHCCYCEIQLTEKNYTREHVISKHKGGKVIKPCCRDCNQEKGGLILHSYIQMLNLILADTKTNSELYTITQRKIINANNIARTLTNLPTQLF